MNSLEQTLVKIAQFLNKEHIPYMVIGGVANLFWGVSRTTLDVDITVQTKEKEMASFTDKIGREFHIRVKDPHTFVVKTRVIPLEDSNGVRIDLIFAKLPYEVKAIQRAKEMSVGNVVVQVCSPEDLIIHKIISDRSRDQEDVNGVIHQLGSTLDRNYMDPIVKELSESFAKSGIWEFYLQCFEKR